MLGIRNDLRDALARLDDASDSDSMLPHAQLVELIGRYPESTESATVRAEMATAKAQLARRSHRSGDDFFAAPGIRRA